MAFDSSQQVGSRIASDCSPDGVTQPASELPFTFCLSREPKWIELRAAWAPASNPWQPAPPRPAQPRGELRCPRCPTPFLLRPRLCSIHPFTQKTRIELCAGNPPGISKASVRRRFAGRAEMINQLPGSPLPQPWPQPQPSSRAANGRRGQEQEYKHWNSR